MVVPYNLRDPVSLAEAGEAVSEAIKTGRVAGAFCALHLHGRKRYDGQVFLAFVGLYAVARFALEFFRSDDRGGLFGLTTSQLIGALLLVGVVAVHRRRLAAVA